MREWIDSMPFVRTLGLACESAAAGVAICRLELSDETSFAPGGGFPAATIGALVDVCAGAAVASELPSGQVVATVDYSFKMLARAPGPVAIARARTLRRGRSAVASVEVRTLVADDEPFAIGLVTLRPLPAAST